MTPHDRVDRLEKKVEQLKMALYNPAGYRNQTAPMECPVCGQGTEPEGERSEAKA